ncbi:aminotransferase class V-fold PLP-dependent enzyme [Alloactinosynnema sp. L-07]|uniref:aminotransferase class V-fold PLP-dependent enzyme n=1 Tax=Alloactinosynnema sp. L-07 TaxID=1653480 RepID=UPI0006B5DD90|nr:aminotransferase class V-fold PLP-dependent enzyme [Alloactinosynnema sp. L-07]
MAFGERFDIQDGYLNTASIGVPPARVADALEQAVTDWRQGLGKAPDYDEPTAVARRGWARLVGVDPANVAIGASVSQLVALVAAGIPDGTRVLTVGNEFTSATFPFAAQAHRGVTVTEVPQAELVARAPEFDLVAVGVVQSADGTVADLDGLRACGARVMLDATQSVGWLPVDLSWADWVVGSSYKWLLAPRGAAWLAIRPDVVDLTRPIVANWYSGETPWDTVYGLPLRFAGDARAFDLSPVWFAQVGAAAALTWFAELDVKAVRDHCVGLANRLLTGLDQAPGDSAIVSLDNADGLADAGIRGALRAGRTRLSFHLYNTEDDVDRVLKALR